MFQVNSVSIAYWWVKHLWLLFLATIQAGLESTRRWGCSVHCRSCSSKHISVCQRHIVSQSFYPPFMLHDIIILCAICFPFDEQSRGYKYIFSSKSHAGGVVPVQKGFEFCFHSLCLHVLTFYSCIVETSSLFTLQLLLHIKSLLHTCWKMIIVCFFQSEAHRLCHFGYEQCLAEMSSTTPLIPHCCYIGRSITRWWWRWPGQTTRRKKFFITIMLCI